MKKILKIGVFIVVVSAAVWNAGINETKVLFTNFLSLEAMAKQENICLGEMSNNTGTCKKNVPSDTGSTCVDAGFWDSKNCYGTGTDNFPD